MNTVLLTLLISTFFLQNCYAQCTIPIYSLFSKSNKVVHTNQIYLSNTDMLKKSQANPLDSFYPSAQDSTFKEIEIDNVPVHLSTIISSFVVENCGAEYANKVITSAAYKIDKINLSITHPELSKAYSAGLQYYLNCEVNIEPLVTLFFRVITDSNSNVLTFPPFKVHPEAKSKYTLCDAYSSILNKFRNISFLDVEHIALYYDNIDNKNYYVFRFTDYRNKEPKFSVGCKNEYTLTYYKVDLQTGQAFLIGEDQEQMCID